MSLSRAATVPPALRLFCEEWATSDVADDQKWLIALLRKHSPESIRLLWRMLGSEADVLDAYQSAICRLVDRKVPSILTNGRAYFVRTVLNAGIQLLRERNRRHRHWPAVIDSARRQGRHCASDHVTDMQEDVQRLRKAIGELPKQLCAVIALRDLAEIPYRNVAQILGVRVSTARMYRRQAVVRLARALTEEIEP